MSLVTDIYGKKFGDFKKGYGEALKWTEEFRKYNFSSKGMEKLRNDCGEFFSKNIVQLKEATDQDDYDYGAAGHDYWLTRNGHGAGFWDRDLGKVGDELTKACEYTEVHAFLIDKKIHME